VIFRFYDAVRGTALAGDIPARSNPALVAIMPCHYHALGLNLQVNEIALVILHGCEAVYFQGRDEASRGWMASLNIRYGP
jgi:hypothetical protein